MIDPLRDYPGYALRRASASVLTKLASQLALFQLRSSESSVLLLIAANPGRTQSEIGRVLDIERANMAPLTQRLEERGLIVRASVDRRSQGLDLTEAGAALATEVTAVLDAFEADVLARVPSALQPHVLPILHALRRSQ